MGNIVSGHELISRVTDIKVYGIVRYSFVYHFQEINIFLSMRTELFLMFFVENFQLVDFTGFQLFSLICFIIKYHIV